MRVPRGSRRCKRGAFTECHWETGKAVKVMILEPEDLPVCEYRQTLRVIGRCVKYYVRSVYLSLPELSLEGFFISWPTVFADVKFLVVV